MASSSSSDSISTVVSEFQQWFDQSQCSDGASTLLFLIEKLGVIIEFVPLSGVSFRYKCEHDHSQQKDGSVRLDLSFSNEGTFSLIAPVGYPNDPQPLFEIRHEADRLSKWAKSMNTYAHEKRGDVKLAAILSRAVETVRHYDQRQAPTAYSDDEGLMEDDDDEHVSDDDDEEERMDDDGNDGNTSDAGLSLNDEHFTTTWEIDMDLRKKRWLAKETEMRNKMAEKKTNDEAIEFYSNCKKSKNDQLPIKPGRQIFAHESAGFQILSNEMSQLIKSGKEDGFLVDTIDDCLYKWSVKVFDFPKASELEHQLTIIGARFGYRYVELQLDFVPDFPFYPPLLRVVRPRFFGSIVQSLANIDLLKVTYWNPAKTVLDVLRQMKSILLQHARLDVDADRNDISAYPEGAYHPIEDHLIKLALATECRPRANSTIIDVDSLEKAPQMRQQQITVPMVDLTTTGDSTSAADNNSAVDSALTGWAKGTGYGSGNRQSTYGWNPDEYLRAQKEKDRQILAILEALLENISHNRRSISSTELYQIIEGSAFIPFLEMELSSATFIEIGRHSERYRLLFDLIEAMAGDDCLLPLFCKLRDQKHSIRSLLEDMCQSAKQYLRALDLSQEVVASTSDTAIGGGASAATSSSSSATITKRIGRKLRKKYGTTKGSTTDTSDLTALPDLTIALPCATTASSLLDDSNSEEMDVEQRNALRIVNCLNMLNARLADNGLPLTEPDHAVDCNNSTTAANSSSTRGDFESLDEFYIRELKPLLFNTYPAVTVPNAPFCHYFAKEALANKPDRDAVRAIFKDVTSLQQSLPITSSSSIFVRYDENNVNMMQALIIGPENTPYANGCFLFDIYFSSRYPRFPPSVNSRTNGGGRVRFNPNLYDCGKVCLSLLGTWTAEKGESWSPGTSTLLQVLVSIQSLILIEDPYFNEPGFENSRGTPDGDKRSASYNHDVRANCLKWAMLEQLRSPPPVFATVIRKHFLVKRDVIRSQLDEWLKLDKTLKDSVKQMRAELDKLT